MTDREEATQRFTHAESLFRAGQWDEAADAFAELLMDPGQPAESMPDIHWDLGVCALREGNPDLARQHFAAGGFSEAEYLEAFTRAGPQTGAGTPPARRSQCRDGGAPPTPTGRA